MSDHVSYKGHHLGKVCLDDTNTGKVVFIADDLNALATLFRIEPTDEIEIESVGKIPYIIPYKKFQQDYLSGISGFYPTRDEWLLKNRRGRTIEESEKSQNPG